MKERLKQLRRILDLTQQEFAVQIGSVQNTITGYETGRRIPSNQVITLICKTFNVNETWLRTGEGEMFIDMSRDEEIAAFVGEVLSEESDNFKKRFITILSKLKESEWEVLEHIVEEMKKD